MPVYFFLPLTKLDKGYSCNKKEKRWVNLHQPVSIWKLDGLILDYPKLNTPVSIHRFH